MDFSKYNVTVPHGDYHDMLQEELERIDKLPLTRDEYNRLRELAPQVASQKLLPIRREYNLAQAAMHKLFEKDMEEEFGFSYLPEEIKQKIHYTAWENGRSGGYSNVYAHYPDIADLVESVWNIAKEHFFVGPAYCATS